MRIPAVTDAKHLLRPVTILSLCFLLALQVVLNALPAQAACPASFPVTVPAGDTARLIEVIGCANATASNDVINLTAGSIYTLTSGDLNNDGLPAIGNTASSGTLTINGNGATITRSSVGGTPNFRIFSLAAGSNLTLNQVTVSNGRIAIGAAGIHNSGGTLLLVASTLDSNYGFIGGGIYNGGGSTTTLRDSTLSNNIATNYGGGVVNQGATLNVVNSTISGNLATGTAASSGGGAINSFGASAQVNIYNSTIANNTATSNPAKSGIWQENGTLSIRNSIVANNNGANNCLKSGGTFTDNGNNLDNGNTCGFGGAVGQNINPSLGSLANNGGFTFTHALLPNSAAINKGSNANAVDQTSSALTTDQRGSGFPRISAGTVDIGSFEYQCPTFPANIPAGNSDLLIGAITCANATNSNDVINLASASTYALMSGDENSNGLPAIASAASSGTLTINGNGATIFRSSVVGTPNFRIFSLVAGSNLTLNQITISNGRSTVGAGIFNSGGALQLVASTVDSNYATNSAGIYNSNSGTTSLRNSTISNNTATDYGGGVVNASATLNIVNSTISGNRATGTAERSGGGAINSYGASAQVNIYNSTIAENAAATVNAAKSGIWQENGTLTVQNSIVANNYGGYNCQKDGGTFIDNGNNLEDSSTCGFGGAVGQNSNSYIAPLANNGGVTFTHALLPGSAAINAGSNALAVDHTSTALTTDQRGSGFPRISGGTVDIGAYEYSCPTFPVNVPAGDSDLLINAIACANATAANDVINLTPASTYTLTSGDESGNGLPAIASATSSGTLTINGNGAIITRSGGALSFRIFLLNPGSDLTLNQVTVSNGWSTGNGGGIFNGGGTLRLVASTVDSNRSTNGGGIYNGNGSTTILRNSTISNNTATNYGGGVVNSSATLNVVNSTISGNDTTGTTTSSGGGAINSYGASAQVNIYNSTIADNTAATTNATKSGIWQENGTLTLRNSIVANNNGANNCLKSGGTFTDNGNNLDNGTTCGFGGTVGQNNDPNLAPLGNNGGLTFTHALQAGSPAINAGSNALAVDHTGAALTTDQRGSGFPRINNTTVDIGAFESVAGTINLQLTLQGRSQPAPHPSRVVSTQIRLLPSGGGAPLFTTVLTSNQSSVVVIPNIPAGTYVLGVKGSHTLARQSSITIVSGINNITTAVLLEGDANDNNSVTLPDFSILATTFGKALGEAGYDARADFNGDNIITISDFSLLASNFGTIGE